MKKLILLFITILITMTSFSGCYRNRDDNETSGKKKYRIALITMSSIDQHWIYCREGADKAAKELGCTLDFLAPTSMDNALSIEQLNNAVAAGYDAILYAPISPDASIAALREADNAGVVIVYVDAAANYPGNVTYGTDGYKGGVVAAENMLKVFEKKGITGGKIGVVSVNKSLVSCEARPEGFIEVMKEHGFEILETQYCDGDASKSQTICENYITQGVVGIFAANEGSSIGAGNAIKASGKDIVGVGFDTNDTIAQLVEKGYLQVNVYQRPKDMGYYGVKAAIDILENGTDYKGEFIDTGVDVKLYEG